jgi:hypothetical protein
MSSKRQLSANRKNARKSTGPKSLSGKSKSAKNAQSHGLTKPPEASSVLNWFRVILNDGSASPGLANLNERMRAAYRLAETEAHLQNVRTSESFLCLSLLKEQEDLKPLKELSAKTSKVDLKEARKFCSILDILTDSFAKDGLKKIRILNRYLSEAESARRKALKAWIEVF